MIVDEPPVSEGTDAVAAWAQAVGITLSQEMPRDRVRMTRATLDVLGRCATAARDAEALLKALEQHGEPVESATGAEVPADEVALTLWQWYEVARQTWVCAVGPMSMAAEAAATARTLGANIRARPTARAEDIRRRLKLPRDARQAVRAHEEVTAKLAEEALDAEDVAEARDSLVAFGSWMRRGFLQPAHIRIIADTLERVERGELMRVIVECPPRSGKTNLVSELFPTWYLGRNPDRDIIIASHSQERADDVGRAIRNGIGSDEFSRVFPGARVADDSSAAARFNIRTDEEWQDPTGKGRRGGTRMRPGICKSYGRMGRYTGSGANLLLIDDLIAEHEADSDSAKREAHRAIQALRSRLAPISEGAAWVIVNTRYREDDPIGYVLSEFAADGPWTVIKFPSLAAEAEDWELPDGTRWRRAPGDPLWPERYTKAEVEAVREFLLKTSPMDWWGQHMCSPVPHSGAMVDIGWFRRYGGGVDHVTGERTPTREQARERAERVVVTVDTSKGTGANAARTAIETWAELHGHGRMDGAYLIDAEAAPIGFEQQIDRVKKICEKWRPHSLLIEDKSTGEVMIPLLRNATDWVRTPVVAINPGLHGDKVARMSTCTPQIRDGQVWFPERGATWAAPWLAELEGELTFFPRGKLKDMVDALSQFLNWRRENPIMGSMPRLGSNADSTALQRALGGAWHAGLAGRSAGAMAGMGGSRRRGW